MRKFWLLLLIGSWGQWLFAQPSPSVQQSIRQFVTDAEFEHTSIGIHVVRLSNGKVLGTHNGQKSLATASTLKVLTTATALEQKGGDFRYKTPVGYTGKITAGILHGNLVLKGVGDPTFHSKYFPQNNAIQDIAKFLKQRKITQIKGNIILNTSSFNSTTPPTWTWEDIGNYYGTALHPINYRDNTYVVNFRTGKAGTKARILDVQPKQNLRFTNTVTASTKNADNAYIFGSLFSRERLISGTLPQYQKQFTIKGAMPNPALTFGEDLKTALQKQGIRVLGKVQLQATKPQQILGYIQSPKLAEIIKRTNQNSVNLFAEAMLYLLKTNSTNTREELLQSLVKFWQSKGLHTKGLYLHDGSGLSHFDAINPAFFTELLRYMAHSKNAKVFTESLAVSGKSGTLKSLGKGTPLVGKVQGKSGSMRQVCSYVGYMTTQKGEKVAFAILLNNFSIPHYKIRQKISKMVLKW